MRGRAVAYFLLPKFGSGWEMRGGGRAQLMVEKTGTVVVIEDEPDILELLRDVLEAEGFPVIGVVRPSLVDTLLTSVQPQLFLIDLMLPGTSGVELAEHLRADGYNEIPMIAMSASRLMLDVATQSGLFQAALAKPFDLSTLLNYVEHYAEGSLANGG